MKKSIYAVMVFGMAAVCSDAAEWTTRFASNATALVQFSGKTGQGLRITAVDGTSDLATSYLSWRVASGPALSLKAAVAADGTNLWLNTVGFASGATTNVLIQSATGVVTNKTVHKVLKETNQVLHLDQPLAAAVPAGTSWGIKRGTFTLKYPAADDAVDYYLDSVTGLAEGDLFAGQVTPESVSSGRVTNAASGYDYAARLRNRAVSAMAVGDAVYVRWDGTPRSFSSTTAADGTSFHVTTTNGFLSDGYALIETMAGDLAVGAIDSLAETNILLTGAIGIAVTNGDYIWPLTLATTIAEPSAAGSEYLYLAKSNGVIAGAMLVAAPSSGIWQVPAYGLPVRGTTNVVTVMGTLGLALPAGSSCCEVTNVSTTTLSAAAGDATITVPWNATNALLVAGAGLVLFPEDATFATTYRYREAIGYSIVSLTAIVGTALSAGDGVWQSTAQNTPVGAATIRLYGQPLFTAPVGTPAELSLGGTALGRLWCTGVYE